MDVIIENEWWPKTRKDLALPPNGFNDIYDSITEPSFYIKRGQRASLDVEARVDRSLWLRYCDIKRLNSIKAEILTELNKKSTPWYRKLYVKVKGMF